MLIAQISDMHLMQPGELACGVVDTAACLTRCLRQIGELVPRPDLLLATGDLVESGSEAEYRYLRTLLETLPIPFYLIPGNHDRRDTLRAVFHDHAHLHTDAAHIRYAIDGFPLRILMLDTLVPGHEGGLLGRDQIAWLDRELARTDKPVIVAMHHPPFLTGIRDMDMINCGDSGELEAVLRRHPNVERLVCGHVHRSIQLRWAGTAACIAPSTAHQIYPDLSVDSSVPLSFVLEPPGFLLHLWRPETGLITHELVAGDFGPPHAYD